MTCRRREGPGRPGRGAGGRTAAILVLVLALLAASPALGAAAPRWLAPQDLTSAGEPASSPRLVVDAAGVATIAWVAHTPTGTVVRAASRPAGTSAWGPPADLSGPGAGAVVDLVANPGGSVAVLWTVPAAGTPGTVTVHSAVRPAGEAAFGPAEQVPGPAAASLHIALAADGAEGFVAAWTNAAAPGVPPTAYASSRAAAGAWSAPETLSAPGDSALVSDAAGAGGRVAVAWSGTAPGTTGRTVRVRERGPGGAWAPEQAVSQEGASVVDATVALGPGGAALAAWSSPSTAGVVVQAAVRPAGGDWGPPETLGPGGGPLFPPKALLEPDGTATVVWTDSGGDGVVARVRPLGGAFGPPQVLSPSGAAVSGLPAPPAAAGPEGGAVAVWASGGIDTPRVIRAAVKPAGAAPFGPATTISAPAAGLGAQVAAAGPGGEAVAAWIAGSAPLGGTGVLRTADLTERPGAVLEPPPVAVRIDDAPRTSIQGSRVRLRLAVEGFADGLVVRLQRLERGAFRDMGQAVTVDGTQAQLPVRLTVPGRLVLRLAYESRGAPAFSRAVRILVSRPSRPLVPAGTRPLAVRVGLGAVWVLTEDDAGERIVMRLDPRTGRASGEPIPVPGATGLAVGAGAVWVSRGLEDDRGVVRLDPAAGAVAAEIPVVSSGAIAAGPAGVWTVECVRTVGLYPACGEQRLARVDPAANAVSERFTVAEAGDGIASAGGIAVGRRYVWFSVFRDRDTTAHRLDPATGRVASVGGGSSLAARGDVVWGISGRACNVVRARGSGSLVDRGAVAGRPRFRCSGLVFDGRSLWVRQEANAPGFDAAGLRLPARLVRLDSRTARPVGRTIPLGLAPVALDVGGGAVWAASGEEAVVRRIDPRAAARARPSARRHRPPRPRALWRQPARVPGSTSRAVSSLDLAVGPRGRAALVWRRSEARGPGSVVAAVRRSGDRGWGRVRRLASAASNTFAGRPRVDMNGAGEAVAIWTRGGSTFAESTVEAALLGTRAASWGAPATLGEPGTGGIGPDAGIAADGEAVALWSCLCAAGRGPSVLRHAIRPPGGAFGPAAPVGPESAGGFAILDSRLAVAPAGHAVAVWSPAPGAGVSAATRPDGGAFEAPAVLAPPAVLGGSNARVAVNDAGQAVAVWRGDGLVAALRDADGTWGAPQRIAPPGRYSDADEGPDVAIDGAGNALVAVRAFDLETFNFRVMAVAHRAGAPRWEAPMWLSPKGPTEGAPGPSTGDPSLAVNPRGDAVVAWAQTLAGRPRVLARLRPHGRLAWRPLEAASGRQRRPGPVHAAIDAGGAAAIAWAARVADGPAARAVVRVATRPSLAPAVGAG